LLLHGFASDSSSWLPFVAPLAHRYRFIMPDLRGFGRSRTAQLRHACPLTVYAEDIEDLLDVFAIDSLPVVGISMGAFTAVQSFKLFGGRRFKRYLHVDQGPAIRNTGDYAHGLLGPKQVEFFGRLSRVITQIDAFPDVPVYDQLPAELKVELAEIFAEFAAAAFGARPLRAAVRGLVRRESVLRRLMPEEGLLTYLQIMRAYLEQDYDLRAAFRAIQVPMTVLIGGASRMYPAEGQRAIGALVPHARVREVPGAGHVVPVEAPLRFISELRSFLDAP